MMKPWANRTAGEWDTAEYEGKRIYYRQEGRLVTELCRGERYAHISPGLLFLDEQYIGSTLDDWHGGPSGSLTDMVEWIAESLFDGPDAWFIPEEEKVGHS